LPSLEITVTEY